VPRVAIRRTRASKTRGKSYLWVEPKESGGGRNLSCCPARSRRGPPGPAYRGGPRYDRRIDGLRAQIKRVVFFIHSGIPRNPRSDEENGRLSGRPFESTNCPLSLSLSLSLAPERREGEADHAMIFIPSFREEAPATGRRPCAVASFEELSLLPSPSVCLSLTLSLPRY